DGILVDAGLHLHRPEDEPVLGEPVHDDLPVVGNIVAYRHPGDHVVPTGRGERKDEDKLRLLARQAHSHIVWLHADSLVAEQLRGDHPDVLAIVKHPGIAHVERGIHLRLNLKQVHWVAQVGAEFGPYLRYGPEELGEDPGGAFWMREG